MFSRPEGSARRVAESFELEWDGFWAIISTEGDLLRIREAGAASPGSRLAIKGEKTQNGPKSRFRQKSWISPT